MSRLCGYEWSILRQPDRACGTVACQRPCSYCVWPVVRGSTGQTEPTLPEIYEDVQRFRKISAASEDVFQGSASGECLCHALELEEAQLHGQRRAGLSH